MFFLVFRVNAELKKELDRIDDSVVEIPAVEQVKVKRCSSILTVLKLFSHPIVSDY